MIVTIALPICPTGLITPWLSSVRSKIKPGDLTTHFSISIHSKLISMSMVKRKCSFIAFWFQERSMMVRFYRRFAIPMDGRNFLGRFVDEKTQWISNRFFPPFGIERRVHCFNTSSEEWDSIRKTSSWQRLQVYWTRRAEIPTRCSCLRS